MPDFGSLVRRAARSVGRQLAEAREEFAEGKAAASLPTDDEGRARIVCRRFAEKRAVRVENGRPACYDPDHPACQGCVEDVRDGSVETW